ncbi:MAG: SDR family oxidoreductase [Cyclobacteriaceae bacterium]|nr:SDR family oxidoreductase [Cyclobacteriaceae bacterium]
MNLNLKNKVALITGASKGIGEGIAIALAAQGAFVVINSRKQEELGLVAGKIKAGGGECLAIAANTSDITTCKALVDKTVATYGGLDILVNNAAANPVFGPVVQTEEWAYDKIMSVNVKAPFELSKLAYPHMKQRGAGSVINISSIAGDTPDPGLGIYSVSKAALNMLTKVMAKEWGPDNIRVNAICPGLIKTKFSQALWQDEAMLKKFMKLVPMGRMGTVGEIASLAVFLASDASAYCTGSLFTADGGTTI